jgi:hypothetical protein
MCPHLQYKFQCGHGVYGKSLSGNLFCSPNKVINGAPVDLVRNCTSCIERQIQDLVLILIDRRKHGIDLEDVVMVIKTYTDEIEENEKL